MSNKKSGLILGIIVFVVIAVIVGGIFFYTSLSSKGLPETKSTSKDGSVGMSAEFLDGNGKPVSAGTAQSTLGGNVPLVTYMALTLQVKYTTGNIALQNLRLGTATTPLSENLLKDSPFITTLQTSQTTLTPFITTKGSCSTNADCDAKEACISSVCWINLTKYESANVGIANIINFSTTIKYNVNDAYGNPTTLESQPVGLTYDIRGEACIDGTKYNTCGTTKPGYCTNSTPSGTPSIIDKASVCGCPTNEHASGDSCVPNTCSDSRSTLLFTCDSTPTASLITSINANKRYCATSNSALVENCTACGCATDFNSGIGTCTAGLCVYPTYTGGLSGCIPKCAGVAAGQSDGCSGVC